MQRHSSRHLAGLVALAVMAVLAMFAVRWAGVGQRPLRPAPQLADAPASPSTVAYERVELASGLDTPWSVVFTSATRLFVTERPGRLRVVENGVLRKEPLHTFAEVSERGEEGLMSLALHPAYATNRLVYASLAYAKGADLVVKVVRFRDDGTSVSDMTTVLDGIPAAQYHAGCALAFGPDGMLYVTTGDATDGKLAQDLSSLAGKILRMTPEGGVPEGNPFPGSLVWSYGHRNPQGIAWTADGTLYASEHGPSLFDGPAGGDEVNRIVRGGNYGWPTVSHERRAPGTEVPLALFTPAEAPGSLLAYSGAAFPQFAGKLLFGALRGEGIVRVTTDGSAEKLAGIDVGRVRALAQAPDGSIVFSTSNRDGRGTPAAGDDRLWQLLPIR
jgi:glucose/arabinose dehydrogenase